MRYVRYARHEGEKNLVAIQYERNVYYKTVNPFLHFNFMTIIFNRFTSDCFWGHKVLPLMIYMMLTQPTPQGKEVGPNTELLVWYSTSYAQTLKIPSAGQITPDGKINCLL